MKPQLPRSCTYACLVAVLGCISRTTSTEHASDPDTADEPPPEITGDHNLIRNGRFDGDHVRPWLGTFDGGARGTVELDDGRICVEATEFGGAIWDAQLRHRFLALRKGHRYRIAFAARANRKASIRPRLARTGPPYEEYWASAIELDGTSRRYVGHFTMRAPDDDSAELAFHLGGVLAGEGRPLRVCLDDIELSDPEFVVVPVDEASSPLHVDQVGYTPGSKKIAVLADRSKDPISWQVLDAGGAVVLDGTTSIFGEDRASGDHVHHVDLSSLREAGRGYRVRAAGKISGSFDVDQGLWRPLYVDALRFFFHNRSGVAFEMPYAGDPQWVRPPGHPGDKRVRCLPELECKYDVDASGGWYDAGDHGKYVVNAGISLWTLLNLYERSFARGGDRLALLDSVASIPESGNGVPDLLDEARFELEFLLRMQVPHGQALAGLVHHKVHDKAWTSLPHAPHQSTVERFVHAPSTAATLDFAAVTAMAARIFRRYDERFAATCLAAAEQAFRAAKKHPGLIASGADDMGGGPYGDVDVSDEWYWAAVELYLASENGTYRAAFEASEHFLELPAPPQDGDSPQSAMSWQEVAALATISLAVSAGDPRLRDRARNAVIEAGKRYQTAASREGYRVPLSAGPSNRYPWGSNSLVLNNMVVMALAYDFSGAQALLDATAAGLDYLLGVNPLGLSYVTGLGERAVSQPHHRLFAHSLDPAFPIPPSGMVSGGPNSGLEDPEARAAGIAGCPPQRCYVDRIAAWSVNEVAINWNAPLVWIAAFLDENARLGGP